MAWTATQWTAPRTWVQSETVTAALMNTHVRDNFKVLGDFTRTVSGAPMLLNQIKGTVYSTQVNSAGGGDTELTDYTFTIPANTFDVDGAGFDWTTLWVQGAAAETASMKFSIGSSGVMSIAGSGAATTLPVLHLSVARRNGSVNGLFYGYAYLGAADGGNATCYVVGSSFSCNWAIDQTFKLYASSNTAGNLSCAYSNIDIWGGQF